MQLLTHAHARGVVLACNELHSKGLCACVPMRVFLYTRPCVHRSRHHDTDPLQSATTQLQLLNSVNFHTTATRSILCLRSWRMTAPVVAALQHLPHWPNAAVLFGECVWPLEPEQYAQLLPVNVPTCFTEWHFDRPTLESPVGVAMSAGVAAHRQELGLPAARVLQASTGGLEAPQDSDPDTESDGYC